jgi:hypothetical protein
MREDDIKGLPEADDDIQATVIGRVPADGIPVSVRRVHAEGIELRQIVGKVKAAQ